MFEPLWRFRHLGAASPRVLDSISLAVPISPPQRAPRQSTGTCAHSARDREVRRHRSMEHQHVVGNARPVGPDRRDAVADLDEGVVGLVVFCEPRAGEVYAVPVRGPRHDPLAVGGRRWAGSAVADGLAAASTRQPASDHDDGGCDDGPSDRRHAGGVWRSVPPPPSAGSDPRGPGPASASESRSERPLHQLVGGNELDRRLQGHRPRRNQPERVLAGRAIGRWYIFFSLVGLTSMSPVRAFSPTIIPSYTSSPGPDQQLRPLLEVEQGVGGGLAGPIRHQHAVGPMGHLAGPRPVSLADLVQQRRARASR